MGLSQNQIVVNCANFLFDWTHTDRWWWWFWPFKLFLTPSQLYLIYTAVAVLIQLERENVYRILKIGRCDSIYYQ
jgi:hypothetical protein